MNKPDSSRFDNLFDAARKRSPETEELNSDSLKKKPEARSKSKSTSPNYVRTTIYFPKHLHKKLKTTAADEEKEMSDIVEESVRQYLESRNQESL